MSIEILVLATWVVMLGGAITALIVRNHGEYGATEPPPQPGKLRALYETAVLCLGEHVTLDPSVPTYVGCAEAVSFVLRSAGYLVPTKGVPDVLGLIQWLLANGFKEVSTHAPGTIIASHNPNPALSDFSHIGICGQNWIMSNTSFTGSGGLKAGTFQANYQFSNWMTHFKNNGSFVRYFVPTEN